MTPYETFDFFIRRLADGALLRLIDDAEASFHDDADYVRAVATDILIERGFLRNLEQI
jgi:hypothetical protein